jgi:subtilisin-like proprotein convertase family protein
MSYTAISDNQVDLDSPIDTTLMQGLRDNAQALRFQVFAANISASTTSTAYTAAGTWSISVPDFPDESGYTRSLTFETLLTSELGTATAYFRIRDTGSSTTGSEASTSDTSGISAESSFSVPSTWGGTRREVVLEVRTDDTNSAASVDGTRRVTSRLYY